MLGGPIQSESRFKGRQENPKHLPLETQKQTFGRPVMVQKGSGQRRCRKRMESIVADHGPGDASAAPTGDGRRCAKDLSFDRIVDLGC